MNSAATPACATKRSRHGRKAHAESSSSADRIQSRAATRAAEFDASLATSGIAAISVTDAVATSLLASAGKNLKELQDKLDTGDLMGGIDCKGTEARANIVIQQEKKKGRNVLGGAALRQGARSTRRAADRGCAHRSPRQQRRLELARQRAMK
jgi:hypothetical protein